MTERNLAEYRFAPSEESLRAMKELKNTVNELSTKHPEIAGIAFFGSRTTGLDRHTSDQDVVLFVDGTHLVPKEQMLTVINGQLHINPRAKIESVKLKEERESLYAIAVATIENKMQELNLPVDKDEKTGRNKTVMLVDISKNATDKVFNEFKVSVDRDTNFGKLPLVLNQVGPFEFNILSRFYLAIGNGIYANREYILDKFEALDARYFQALMQYLQYSERTKTTTKRDGLEAFKHYPKTIIEARKYFRTEPIS